MGYYTKLEVKTIPPLPKVLIHDSNYFISTNKDGIGVLDADYPEDNNIEAPDDDYEGDELFEIKWYVIDNDFIKTSRKYPDTLFVIDGYGDEGGDLWRMYLKNGKVQEWRFSSIEECADPFDESKLVEYVS